MSFVINRFAVSPYTKLSSLPSLALQPESEGQRFFHFFPLLHSQCIALSSDPTLMGKQKLHWSQCTIPCFQNSAPLPYTGNPPRVSSLSHKLLRYHKTLFAGRFSQTVTLEALRPFLTPSLVVVSCPMNSFCRLRTSHPHSCSPFVMAPDEKATSTLSSAS